MSYYAPAVWAACVIAFAGGIVTGILVARARMRKRP